jgi:phosphoribosylformylglycinamidine synthase
MTKNELGGSQYFKLRKRSGGLVPKVDAAGSLALMRSLGEAMRQGLVRSCHDCSEGGLAVTLAEMAIAGDKGMTFDLNNVPAEAGMSLAQVAFAESNSRFIVEVRPEDRDAFETLLARHTKACCGTVCAARQVTMTGKGGRVLVKEKVAALRDSWRQTLAW